MIMNCNYYNNEKEKQSGTKLVVYLPHLHSEDKLFTYAIFELH